MSTQLTFPKHLLIAPLCVVFPEEQHQVQLATIALCQEFLEAVADVLTLIFRFYGRCICRINRRILKERMIG